MKKSAQKKQKAQKEGKEGRICPRDGFGKMGERVKTFLFRGGALFFTS